MVIFGEPLKHVITLCGQILVSRKLAIRDDPNIRLRCSRNVVCALCRHTRGRFERTHGDVLYGHGVFQRFRPHTTQTTHHTTTQDTTPHGDRQRQRDNRGRRGDEREEDRTRDKSRKKREKIHFQYGGAWPFFVGAVICLVNPVCARDLSFLNSVQ